MTEEQKRKISEANKGKKRTDEMKKNMSEAHKGKYLKKSTRLKLSAAMTGRIMEIETKKKMAVAKYRSVMNVDTGKKYVSVLSAASETGLTKSGIAYSCRTGKTYKGTTWGYVSEKKYNKSKDIRKSGIPGIRWVSKIRRWKSFVVGNSREIYIGTYYTLKEAVEAQKIAIQKISEDE